MNRRGFLSTLGVAAAAASVGTVPVIITEEGKSQTVNAPKCAGCGHSLILKGIGTTAAISCSNSECVNYFDDDTIERMFHGPLGDEPL